MEFSSTTNQNLWQDVDNSKVKSPPTNTTKRNRLRHPPTPAPQSNTEKHKTTTEFKPDNNIVISIQKTSQAFTGFSHDLVRRTINQEYGPILIKKISPYKFNSDNPRIMIQMDSPVAADDMIKKWKTKTFGDSHVRKTINPKTFTVNVAMLKGVPLDVIDAELEEQVQSQFPGATTIRNFCFFCFILAQ